MILHFPILESTLKTYELGKTQKSNILQRRHLPSLKECSLFHLLFDLQTIRIHINSTSFLLKASFFNSNTAKSKGNLPAKSLHLILSFQENR